MKLFTSTKVDLDDLSEKLEADFNPTQTSLALGEDTLRFFNEYQSLYANHQFQPFWLNENGLNSMALGFLSAADSIKYDAVTLDSLHLNTLREVKKMTDSAKLDVFTSEKAELLLTRTFFAVYQALVFGQKESNKNWKIKDDTLFSPSVAMQNAMQCKNIQEALNTLRPQHPWYAKFRNEYIKIYGSEPVPVIPELDDLRDTIETGTTSPHITDLRKRLNREVALPKDTTLDTWDSTINEALARYQGIHQLKKTGWIDSATYLLLRKPPESKQQKLALNMERMRRMNKDFKQPFVWVVVPRMELDYIEHDSVTFNMRVVVGRTSRPTPSLKSRIENIVFSPPWTVPPTIMKEEVIPGIARRGISYLTKRGLRAIDSKGRRVDASMINSSNYHRFSIGQSPGYRSSLGEVKFNMVNPWAIYMHDTPHRNDFVKSYRAYSSGCIRVHHPKEFAAFLLQDSSKYSYEKIDSICKRRRTIYVPMKRDIDVYVAYLTTAVDSSGQVVYLKDIYKWDDK